MRTAAWDAWTERARAVRIEDETSRRGIKLNGKAGERCGPCPKCGGEDRFSINTKKQVFNCRGCGARGGDAIALVEFLDGVDFVHAVETLTGEPPPKANGKDRTDGARTVAVETYPYLAAGGEIALVVVRVEYKNPDGSWVLKDGKRKKTFRQKRPDPDRPGEWIWDTDGVPPLIFRLPEIIEAIATERTILIVEGERKSELLWKWGVPATCCPIGAGHWKPEHSEFLRGADVLVLPDNDPPGRKHVDAVARSLSGIAARVRILELPGLPPKGDIVDWTAGGHTREELDALIEQAPDYPADGPMRDEVNGGDDFGRDDGDAGGAGAHNTPNTEEPKAKRSKKVAPGDGARPPEFSDDALALRFADQHVGELRYVADWSRWLRWDGTHWQFDRVLATFDRARRICRAAAMGCNKLKLAKELASAKTVAAIERLARCDPGLAATTDQWDADPWLINTPKGMIDLRTGAMREHRADDYVTHITAVAPGGDCPLWHAFLDRVTAGDAALQQYLQRVCGYALTGLTREQALFFLYGTGANGKGTFVNTVSGILDDYRRTAPIETFVASQSDKHPTDLAGLRGARLVTVTETEEGRRWAEAKIKALTGGDEVSARFMRQDFFDYTPQFKLMISGNHKPGLRSVDEAIRRRFNLVPFVVTVPVGERDLELANKLKAEWSGILQWMVNGCLDWQERGLAPPEAVTAATAAYLEAQDSFAAWFDECCDRNPNAWERSQTLFASWKTWAEQSGQFVGDAKTFRARLENTDNVVFKKERHTKRAGFQGVCLKPSEPAAADPYYDR